MNSTLAPRLEKLRTYFVMDAVLDGIENPEAFAEHNLNLPGIEWTEEEIDEHLAHYDDLVVQFDRLSGLIN